MALQIRRGTNAERQTVTPLSGEPIWCTDTKKMWMGDGVTPGGIQVGAINLRDTVAEGEIVPGEDGNLLYVDETETLYRYVSVGVAYVDDNTYVLSTGDLGTSRWVGFAGKYSVQDEKHNWGTMVNRGDNTEALPLHGAEVEMMTNFSFATDLSGWTNGGGWSWVGNDAYHTPGTANTLSQDPGIVIGRHYQLDVQVVGVTAGYVSISLSGGGIGQVYVTTDHIATVVTASNTNGVVITPSIDFNGAIRSVSVVEITPSDPLRSTEYDDGTPAVLQERTGAKGTYSIFNGTDSGRFETLFLPNANVGLGFYALRSLRKSAGNVAIGAYALTAVCTELSWSNVAIGYSAGYSLIGGQDNVLIGTNASELRAGSRNVMIGNRVGQGLFHGEENVIIGDNAGRTSNLTGISRCIIIGNDAGRLSNSNDKLIISNAVTTEPLVHGDFATKTLTFNGDVATNKDSMVVYNNSGLIITQYRVVKIVGRDSTTLITPEIDEITSFTDVPVGILQNDIDDTERDVILTRGSIQVTGFNTTLSSIGAPVFSDASGNLTLVHTPLQIGYVINLNANGIIYFDLGVIKEIGWFATVANAEAASGYDNALCYVLETETFYRYEATAGTYVDDNTYVLSTAEGGTTRWLGIGGQYSVNGNVLTVNTVASAEAMNGQDGWLIYVVETDSFYRYEATAGTYVDDNTYVLSTADGGTTRWLAVGGKYNVNSNVVVVATVAEAEAMTGQDNWLIFCVETDSLYRYEATASTYTDDNTYVLSTADGGDTRWISIAGKYSATTPNILDLNVTASQSEASIGANLVTNGTFATNDFTGWTAGANWSAVTGAAVHTPGSTASLSTNGMTIVAGKWYKVKFTLSGRTSGGVAVSLGGTDIILLAGQISVNANGWSVGIQATNTNQLIFTPNSIWDGAIDNVLVQEVTEADPVISLQNTDLTVQSEIRTGGSGNYSSFFGLASGVMHDGQINLGIGYGALAGAHNTSNNTAIGFRALNKLSDIFSSNNIAIGGSALQDLGYGSGNGAFGGGVFADLQAGSFNVGVGPAASRLLKSGDNNTSIGYRAGYSAQEASGNIFIGAFAGETVTASNKLVIANSNTLVPLIGGDFALRTLNLNADVTTKNNISRVYNNSGSSINAFEMVKMVGVYVTEVTPYIDQVTSYNDYILGIATATITTGSIGGILTKGVLTVTGFNTTLSSIGAPVYSNETGGLTLTQNPRKVGTVLSLSVNGVIYFDFNNVAYPDYISSVTEEPTGFPIDPATGEINVGDSVLSFVNGTRTFSINPTGASFDYYVHGRKFTSTGNSIVIANSEGEHYIYFDDDGTIAETNTFDIDFIYSKALIAIVYWDVSAASNIYIGDERHGTKMDGHTHGNLHLTQGTVFRLGCALNTLSTDQDGSSNAHAQFGLDVGSVLDEDLSHSLSSIISTIGLPVYYKTGAGGDWNRAVNAGYAFTVGATPLPNWNQWTGATWQVTESLNNDFLLCHVFATNASVNQYVSIMGQAKYATKSLAQTGANNEMSSLVTTGLPFAEFTPIATVIFQCRTAYTNTPNARIVTTDEGLDYVDWRYAKISPSTNSVTSHSNLSNLSNDDHREVYVAKEGRTGDIIANATIGTINDLPNLRYTGILFNGVGAVTLTGLGNAKDSKHLTLINDTGNALTISNESGLSVAGNRIITGTGADLLIADTASIPLVYDEVNARWRVAGGSGGGTAGAPTGDPLRVRLGAKEIDGAVNLIDTDISLYTVPGGSSALKSHIVITNRNSAVALVRLAHVDGAIGSVVNADYILYDTPFQPYETKTISIPGMEAADSILVRSDTVDVNFKISGFETATLENLKRIAAYNISVINTNEQVVSLGVNTANLQYYICNKNSVSACTVRVALIDGGLVALSDEDYSLYEEVIVGAETKGYDLGEGLLLGGTVMLRSDSTDINIVVYGEEY